MNRVLLNLDKAIQYYGIPHLNENEHVKADENLLSALFDLESNLLYDSKKKPIIARKSFRLFYSQLCCLFEQLFQYKNEQTDETILKYHQLLMSFEDSYRQHMDPQASLSKFRFKVLKVATMEQFPSLKATLLEKDVSECFLLEIQYALEEQFNAPDRNLNYGQYLFFTKLMRVLKHIAHDTWDRDYNHCFIKFMININFNHMGFLYQCCALLDRTLDDIEETDKQLDYLENILLKLKQVARYPTVQFDSTSDGLSKSLIQYVEKKIVKTRKLSPSLGCDSEENSGILSNLTAGGLTVCYHYFQKAKFIKGKTKKMGVQNFAAHVYTADGVKMTGRQLLKFNKNKLHHEIQSLKNKLKTILDQIENDLGDSATSSKKKSNTA